MRRGFWGGKRTLKVVAVVIAAIFGFTGGVISLQPDKASALTGAEFNPGNIISDAVMFNGLSMTPDDIQRFLNQRVTRCTLGDPGKPPGGIYTDSRGVQYRLSSACLKDYREQIPAISADRYCSAIPAGNYSAAELIYRVGLACNVSQKALLVLLQKEQSLVTHTFPYLSMYLSATGFNCPDTAPCSASSAGFFKQLYSGARQLQVYSTVPAFQYIPVGRTTRIAYHPNSACGGANVFIANRATAALYYYTPYQPNQAALNNLYGTGDGCSAYGNRNFWRIFTDWFGSTQSETGYKSGVYSRDLAGNLWLYPAPGNGSWFPPIKIGEGWGGFLAITGIGDFDGDSFRDVVALDSGGTLWLYPTDGRFGWKERSQLVTGLSPQSMLIAPGDFDANGVPDVIIRDTAGDLWLYGGLGKGRITGPIKIGNGWSMFDAVFGPGDMNSDGLVDLVGRTSNGQLWLYPSAGGGRWKQWIQIGWGWQGMTAIFGSDDFDGDGLVDVLGRHGNGNLYLYSGNGSAGFKSGRLIGVGWQWMNSISGVKTDSPGPYVDPAGAGDIDTDTARDVLVTTPLGELWVYRGNRASGWKAPWRVAPSWPVDHDVVSVGDMNEDLKRDFLLRAPNGDLKLFTVDDVGRVSEPVLIGTGWNIFDLVLGVGDRNGDGHADVIARDPSGNLTLYMGDGRGGWLGSMAVGTGWQVMSHIVYPGDFNGDGKSDLLATDQSGIMYLYPGDGSTGWGAPVVIGAGWAGFDRIMSPGDFNGDGYPDVLARDASGVLRLYAGNGGGGWVSSLPIGFGWGSIVEFN